MAHSSRVGAEYAVAETRRKAVEHGEKKPPGFADRGLNPIQGEESEETDAGYRSAASVATGLTHGHTLNTFLTAGRHQLSVKVFNRTCYLERHA